MGLLHREAFPTLRALLEKIKEVVRVINFKIRTNVVGILLLLILLGYWVIGY